MTPVRRSVLVAAMLAASALVYACVGDDPVASTGSSDAGPGGSADSATPPPGGDAGDDGGNGASCDGGITCNGTCVDTSSDAKNCGRCAHDCGSGMCTNGVCQPVMIVADPDAGGTITSLTTDQTDDNPKGVAVHVFWSATGTGGGIFQDNVNGGNTITLSSPGVAAVPRTNVVVDQTSVYWFLQNYGGPPQPVIKGQVSTTSSQAGLQTFNCPFIQSILYDAANKNVLGTYSATVSTHGAFKCGPVDGTVTCSSLITYSGQPGGNVVTDGTNIYFCDPDNGLILRTTLNGGSSGTYVQSQATPNLLRVDGNNLYWFNSGTKTIQRGPVGSVTTPKQMTSTPNAADGLAADPVNVYWTDSTTGTLNYAPVTGAGPNTPYVTLGPSSTPMRLVRDTNTLYFTHRGAIYRVALP